MRIFVAIIIVCCSFTYTEAQELLHIIDTNDARIIGNNILVKECSECLEQGKLAIQFYDLNYSDLSLKDELIVEESALNYTISSFDLSENGNALCVNLVNNDLVNPNDRNDKIICYNRIENRWLESFRLEEIDLIYHALWVPFSNVELVLSKDGSYLFIAYTKLNDEPTDFITLEILKFDEKDQSFTKVQDFKTIINTNPWLTLNVINDNSTVLISPGYALGGYEHQFIQFNKRDSVWVSVEPEIGQEKLRIQASVVTENNKGDLAVYVNYEGIEHPNLSPNIIFDTLINEFWTQKGPSYITAKTSTVESISVADNGNIIGVGYTNQQPNIFDIASLGFVDLLLRSGSEISRVHRFTYNEALGNDEFGHPYFVQLSSNGGLLMINNDSNQRLIYNISDLIDDFKFTQSKGELIPVQLFPNPTIGQLESNNFEYQKLKAYNSIGQLIGNYEELEQLDLSYHSSGLYTLIFYLDEKPKYIGKVIKI